ncbi:YqfQ family protein [Halalkalibacter oceani]|uniref:YqfQ family protein n=1 Tax=Halalkalibacter oceani TaxID=1653776 RepID=A0A9X2DMN3_9BACI|nr:YqfQ family protein [Halalkalibacter oceani]MCM3712855.1 YqfQ family protein [Halalkalibacter oceani]
MQQVFGPPFGPIPMQPPPAMGGMMSQAGSFAPGAGQFGQFPAAGLMGGGQAVRGGLLARLFGGGAGGIGGAVGLGPGSAAAGGINWTTMLTNAQRVLGLTQQVVPMVQQYGPLVRNLPTIWRIMRSSSDEQETAAEETTLPLAVEEEKEETVPVTPEPAPKQPEKKTIEGMPLPKLYI